MYVRNVEFCILKSIGKNTVEKNKLYLRLELPKQDLHLYFVQTFFANLTLNLVQVEMLNGNNSNFLT